MSIDINSIFTDIRKLGSGNFGTVYSSVLVNKESAYARFTYALKKISLSSASTITKECDALFTLRGCKVIIELLACIVCDDIDRKEYPTVYLVFPCYKVTAWKDYVCDMKLEEMFAYMEKLLSGIAFIHFRGIVHRDIKPQNILYFRPKNVMKIIDFGIARNMHDISMGMKCEGGTYGYRAPELLFNAKISLHEAGKSDVWAAGIIFLCLLTGTSQWFTPPPNNCDRHNDMDGFNLAQFCSLFGKDIMISVARGFGKQLVVTFPFRQPASFPPGADPIVNFLSLRGEDSRFPIEMWRIVDKCLNLVMSNRFSASDALQCVETLRESGRESSKAILGNASSYCGSTHLCYQLTCSYGSHKPFGQIIVQNPSTAEPIATFDFHTPQAWLFFFNFKTAEPAPGESGSPLRSSPFKSVVCGGQTLASSTSASQGTKRGTCTSVVTMEPGPGVFTKKRSWEGHVKKWEISVPNRDPPKPKDKYSAAWLLQSHLTIKPTPDPDGHCYCCNQSFYGTKEAHLMGESHRQAFSKTVYML